MNAGGSMYRPRNSNQNLRQLSQFIRYTQALLHESPWVPGPGTSISDIECLPEKSPGICRGRVPKTSLTDTKEYGHGTFPRACKHGRMKVKIMEQKKISLNVNALWLQYYGLKVETTGKSYRMENVARGPISEMQRESLPEPAGFMVAD